MLTKYGIKTTLFTIIFYLCSRRETNSMKYHLFILLLSLTISIAVGAEEKDVLHSERMPSYEKIWDVKNQNFIARQIFFKHLNHAQIILLGLRQDNPQHHIHAANMIRQLIKPHSKPSIFLSNIARSKQNAFAIFTQQQHRRHHPQQHLAQQHLASTTEYDATGLDILLNLPAQSDWKIIRPVFDVAMLKKLPLKAINLSRYEIGQIHHKGLSGLPHDVKGGLTALLAGPLTEKHQTRLNEEIAKDFCGSLPPKIMEKFALIKRVQRGIFAQELAKSSEKNTPEKAILISSPQHIMKQTGVPYYLEKNTIKDTTISVLFLETGKEIISPKTLNIDVDFIWFTPKEARASPCGN